MNNRWREQKSLLSSNRTSTTTTNTTNNTTTTNNDTNNTKNNNKDTYYEDEVALQALLSSAQQYQETKQQQQSSNKNIDPSIRSKKRPWEENHSHRNDNYDTNRKQNKLKNGGGARRDDDYYGPASHSNKDESTTDSTPIEKQKANFGLSGALTKDSRTGNMYKGVVLKFQEPPEARTPNTLWRFYVFKDNHPDPIETLHISRQSAYLIGRNADIADIHVQHPSCSSQHAVLQYRALPREQDGRLHCQPYIMDLESTNGTFLNGVRIDAARYYQLKKGDVLKFGASTREYVLLAATTQTISK